MKDKVQAIIGHGINCFVNRQLVYNYPEELFADAGIMAIEHADFDGIERLALVTGGGRAASWELTFTCNASLTLSPLARTSSASWPSGMLALTASCTWRS